MRHAGSILADRQGFSLTSDGSILIDGGETIAATDIRYVGREITILGEVPLEPVSSPVLPLVPNGLVTEDLTFPQSLIDLEDLIESDDANSNTEIEETRSVFNAAGGGIDLIATQGTISIGPAVLTANLNINLSTPEAIDLDSAQIFTGGAIDWEATSVTIKSTQDRSVLAAREGLTLSSTQGSIVIEGARLQGATTAIDTESESSAALNLTSSSDIILRSLDAENLSVLFGVEGDIVLEAAGNILNDTGRIISNGDIFLTAGENIDNIVAFPNGSAVPAIQQNGYSGSPVWWTGFTRGRSVRETVLDYGEFDIEDQLAFITATGSITLNAGRNIQNIGGQINANNGDVNLQARNIFSEGLISGRLEYNRRCLVFCSSRANSTLNVSGGLISAGGSLNITAENSIENRGGFFTGLEGVNLEADYVLFESVFLPQIVDRPGGLYNFWSGHTAWLYWRDTLGGVFANDHDVTITRASEIVLKGVELNDLISDIDPTVVYELRQIGNANEQVIGFFHELAPLIGN